MAEWACGSGRRVTLLHPPEKLVHTKEFTMHSKHRAIRLALIASLAASGMAAAQTTTTDQPATNQPAPASSPSDQNVPAETPATGTAGGPSAGKKKEASEEIVVTGSRIRRKDLTTPAPVTVISREQVTASGKVSIGDFLQSLPEQGNAINTQVNNGGDGATRISLRGLGSARTLVLMNGRRFVPGGTGADSSVDLNSIPTAAIERVEVLKDGASAVYGSDAIAGVVNIITRKGFKGTDLSGDGGVSQHGDGNTSWAKLVTGTKNGAFMTCVPGDASTKCVDIGSSSATAAGAAQRWRPYSGAGLPEIGGDQYNFQPQNYNVTPAQRIQLYSIGDLNLGSNARGYYEASFVNRQSEQKLAPEPLLTDGEGVLVSAQSMYNPFGRDFDAIRRRLLEFGNRVFNQDISTFRIVGGVDGTMPEELGPLHGWFWDTSINFGRTVEAGTKQGNIYLRNLQQALGPSMVDPASGRPICVTTPGDPTTVIANCVPLNLFGGAAYNTGTGGLTQGTITPDQTQNLTLTGVDRGLNQMTAAQLNTSGELFPLFGDRPMGLAVGYEYRLLYGQSIPDPLTGNGEISGNKANSTKGGYHVNEGYAELSVPVVNNMPLAEALEATAAFRVFDYSTFGSDVTYKFGGRWRPIHDLTIRGTYSTAFRAPSIGELYGGQADN